MGNEGKCCQRGSAKSVFTHSLTGAVPDELSDEGRDKIIAAFDALEDLIIEFVPEGRLKSQTLTFIEIAAFYVSRFL